MGRKLIGLTMGFLLTIVMAYVLFPLAYSEIIHWLGPYMGPWLRFVLMYLYVIFANPLTFPTIIIVWGVVGFVTGLFVRSIGGSIGMGILIFGLTFLMLVVGGVAMIVPLLFSGSPMGLDFMAMLTNIPPDVSLFDILTAPVLGPIIDAATGGLGGLMGGGGLDPSALIQNILVQGILVPAVSNLIILLVAASIGGIIGRTIFPRRD